MLHIIYQPGKGMKYNYDTRRDGSKDFIFGQE